MTERDLFTAFGEQNAHDASFSEQNTLLFKSLSSNSDAFMVDNAREGCQGGGEANERDENCDDKILNPIIRQFKYSQETASRTK